MAIPQSLLFLEPFIKVLQTIPAEELNEGIDADLLDQLLRDSVAGMSVKRASATIKGIRKSVDVWLADSSEENAAAAWLSGYLAHPDLGRELVHPPEPVDKGPRIHFNTPDGWTERRFPFGLELAGGKVAVCIAVVDEFAFHRIPKEKEQWKTLPHIQATLTPSEVSLPRCHGKRYLYLEHGCTSWKEISYVLAVPGGFVTVWIGAKGEDFDESPIEDRLGTLCLGDMT